MWLNLLTYIISFNLFLTASSSSSLKSNPQGNHDTNRDRVKAREPEEILISSTTECRADVERICDKRILNDNFAVLECIQNDRKKDGADLSQECNHLIWMYKLNITKDIRFEKVAKNVCADFIKEHQKDCKVQDGQRGQFLSCLLDHMESSSQSCQAFLRRMAVLVFSDFHLVYRFTDACGEDIKALHCGALERGNSDAPHSQGSTIECLSKTPEKLQDKCHHEILRIAELQADDFHLDRPLFFACRDDRERLCPQVVSGDSRVYRCLLRHRSHRDMSQECKEQLYRRERLAAHDYKVSRRLARACRDPIRQHHCREDTSDHRDVRLAQILLCLENLAHKGLELPGECVAEMLEHRRVLMENYQLTPELASDCAAEVTSLCSSSKLEATLHCLMDHARRGSDISSSCRRQLEKVVQVADAGEDWRADPALQEACSPVVASLCSQVSPGEGRVLACLMDRLDAPAMAPECRDKLLLLQYFLARDFKLDPQLYRRCHKEAVAHCHAKEEWWDKPGNMDPDRSPIVLPCLYHLAYHATDNVKLSRECLYEVRRVMRQRAVSVDLHPEIEEPCVLDLSQLCSANIGRGQELQCLQRHLDNLRPQCAQAVTNYTAEEAEHLELNYPVYQACSELLPRFCPEIAQDVDQGDLLLCLIAHKNEPLMKSHQKCRMAVEHFQLLSLKDFRFNPKFKQACRQDVLTYCTNIKTKWEMVACLSGIATSDALQSHTPRISKPCRSQLRVELLQRDENVHINVPLDKSCKEDEKKFCSNITPGEGQMLECLKQHRGQLRRDCYQSIFQVEREEMADNAVDYALMTTCKSAIRKYCDGEDMSQVLECLKAHRKERGMDPRCHKLVLARMVEQNSDFRLNVRLQQACLHDIPKFCRAVLDHTDSSSRMEGRVISCLRKYNRQDLLSEPCRLEVMAVVRDAEEEAGLDPQVALACPLDLQNCTAVSRPSECLRDRLRTGQLSSEACRRAVAEWVADSMADIHADPVLRRACAQDLHRHCMDLPSGHGRHLSCLLALRPRLTPECRVALEQRLQMFQFAAQFAVLDSPKELITRIVNSPSRSYLLFPLFGAVCIIFLVGLYLGRAIHKTSTSLKNK